MKKYIKYLIIIFIFIFFLSNKAFSQFRANVYIGYPTSIFLGFQVTDGKNTTYADMLSTNYRTGLLYLSSNFYYIFDTYNGIGISLNYVSTKFTDKALNTNISLNNNFSTPSIISANLSFLTELPLKQFLISIKYDLGISYGIYKDLVKNDEYDFSNFGIGTKLGSSFGFIITPNILIGIELLISYYSWNKEIIFGNKKLKYNFIYLTLPINLYFSIAF